METSPAAAAAAQNTTATTVTSSSAAAAAAERTTREERESKTAQVQREVRRVHGDNPSTRETPRRVSTMTTNESRDADEIEVAPSYFDAVYAVPSTDAEGVK